ncbi:hypothetical protein CASFOL_027466 [Castilleja foliolosa]|uniref:RING-type E3 ubiquitin transferase n=1 Tax=Castilleja foliolosa TaxID=1961234 RepID=A0ABD3CI34_9LAMI
MESFKSPAMSKSNSNSMSNPLLISMLGIVGTSLGLVFYHTLLLKYCIRRQGGGSAADPPRSVASGGTAAGVDKAVLKKIRISPFSTVRGDGANNPDECVVCLGEIEDEDNVRLLPGCKHVFHVMCIDRWFAAHDSCPVCRSPIVEPADVDLSGECSTTREVAVAVLPRAQSDGFIRHCESLPVVRPPEVAERRSPAAGLKRSLSMDQVFAAIGVRCPGYVLGRSGSCSARSNLRHLDRVSSKLRRSFPRMHVGPAGRGAILPY